ncbi:ABC transporter related protein [Methanospirillum hungatei JF-1]|uniref:ABC transporter related protein n=1 Tax=Methanospirillum hungatei JF-1 (strain ATCC 27890 / DSM 864 / NBRC 100397 / JF-1) TaxID=323259 RepID=Q2FMN9_METHJ|nr:ABC transporter ATP-binding protein [Methanospirillum hungatei]ABD39965.1 ABC transporter related protein [Methanospirillum hungatei JF-1]
MTQATPLQQLIRLSGLVKSHLRLLAAGMICDATKQLITIGIGLLGVFLIYTAKEQSNASALLPIGGAILILALARGVCGYFGPYLNHIAAFQVLSDLRNQLYRKVDPLAPAIFISRRTGDLVSVAINNIEILELFFAHTLTQIVVAVLVPLIVLCGLLFIHPSLAGILLIFLIMTALIPTLAIRMNEKKGDHLRLFLANMGSFLIDSVQGIWEILAFGRGKDRLEAIIRMVLEYRKEQRSYVQVNACASASYAVLVSGGIVIVLVAATILTQNGEINPFYLPITVILSAGAFSATREVVEVSKQLSMTIAGAKRFFEIMDDIPVVQENGSPAVALSAVPEIEVSNVWFRYGESEPYVLKGVSFTIPSGCTAAIVGLTGAGKTTLTHLLMRFWDPEKGSIRIDGHDIRDLNLNYLRNTVSIVTQDIFLFNTSIRENIRVGKASATDQEVEQAARFARIHEFISGLPDGYETIVGERGIRLSGGERQRVAIARAILKNSPVLIMDEATSNLDTGTEMMIRDTIRELMKGKTVFMIAHRLSTVVHADTILVLNQGEIIEQGTHHELLQHDGLYASLIAAQEI